jgi:hypothetical protein
LSIYPTIRIEHKPRIEVSDSKNALARELHQAMARLQRDRALLVSIKEAEQDIELLTNNLYQIQGYLHLLER